MPQVFKIGGYWVYFWANENDPLEQVHVHISEGAPTANATKVWITRAGGYYLCHNNSQIPSKTLSNIMKYWKQEAAKLFASGWTISVKHTTSADGIYKFRPRDRTIVIGSPVPFFSKKLQHGEYELP